MSTITCHRVHKAPFQQPSYVPIYLFPQHHWYLARFYGTIHYIIPGSPKSISVCALLAAITPVLDHMLTLCPHYLSVAPSPFRWVLLEPVQAPCPFLSKLVHLKYYSHLINMYDIVLQSIRMCPVFTPVWELNDVTVTSVL